MADNSFKVKNSLQIKPSASAVTEAGDLRVDSGDSNKLKFHDGTTEDTVVMQSQVDDVTADIEALEVDVAQLQTDLTQAEADIDAVEADVATLQTDVSSAQTDIDNHIADTANPHSVTKTQVGLGNVDNTSDANKPVSTAQQAALDLKANIASPTFTGTVTTPLTTAGPVLTSSGGVLSSEAQLAISRGGTGQSTANAALNALLPSQTSNTNKFLRTNGTNTSWEAAGAGGGSKNYLGTVNGVNGNGDFELGATTGWSLGVTGTLSNGLPTTTPTFGSGASGNLSISAVTSGKLAGSYSLSYASSAATTAGNCLASDAFTIDTADQAKVMTVKFYYSPTSNASNANWSGTSSNSFAWAIYDVTNSTWIIPTGCFSMTQSSGVGVATGAFQTSSNGTSYRLVVYNANATSGAITVLFDDFSLGPQTAPIGFAGGDWESYTPVITTSSGTITNYTATGKRRRVGDSYQYQGLITFSGAGGTFTEIFASLGGHVIDTNKILSSATANQVFGTAQWHDNGVEAGSGGTVQWNNSTTFNIRPAAANGTKVDQTSITGTVPITWNTGDTISWTTYPIPIVGLSSNVQMSSDTDTRVIALYATKSGTQSISSGTTAVTSWTSVRDEAGAFNASTGVYTIPVTGWYEFGGRYTITSASGNYGNMVNINGAGQDFIGNYAASDRVSSSTKRYMLAGQTLAPGIFSSASTGTVSTASDFWVNRLTGPSVIAASESVYARYYATATSVTSATTATVVYSTKDRDSHGSYNTSTGIYTAAVSGMYSYKAKLQASATWTAGNSIQFWGERNSSTASPNLYGYSVVRIDASVSTARTIQSSDEVYLNAGDTFRMRANVEGTSPLITGGGNDSAVFSITRVGN